MTDYLPKAATIEQACAWLEQQTGSTWSLAKLLECGEQPWFWFDYSTEAPKEIFGDKTEGYFAPMVFAGDTHRLEMFGEFALVTMTRTHDDNLIKMTPGMRIDLSEIRFKRESLQELADAFAPKSDDPASSGAPESDEATAYHPSIGWQVALYDAWSAMKILHGREPSAAEAIRYLKKNDTSGTILSKGGDNELWWKTNRGKPKEVQFRTVETCISSWRTSGRLPA